MPFPNASTGTNAADAASTLAERLADAVAALLPASVAVVGDDMQLADALTVRGLSVTRSDEAHAPSAALAVVAAQHAHVDEALAKLNGEVRRVLLWHPGEAATAEWMSAAAANGYFRSTVAASLVAGATCVLLDAAQPTLVELVARYEALLTELPKLGQRLWDLRHELLTSRDHAIGAEAEIGQLRAQQLEYEAHITELRDSTTWRVGSKVTSPLGRLKRALRR